MLDSPCEISVSVVKKSNRSLQRSVVTKIVGVGVVSSSQLQIGFLMNKRPFSSASGGSSSSIGGIDGVVKSVRASCTTSKMKIEPGGEKVEVRERGRDGVE